MKHGIYVERAVDDAERQVYEAMVKDLCRDFGLSESSDRSRAEAFSMAFLQAGRAMRAGRAQAAATFHQRMRRHLKALKAADGARAGETAGMKTTPAVWATALVEKARKAQRKGRRKTKVNLKVQTGTCP